jgi:catechol 2,3-dioxygenase-like lactoylglutathione lyase family enzyme
VTRIVGIGHLALASPDVDRLAAYYTEVLGFELSARADGASYLTPELAHHAVTVQQGKESGLDHLAFRIEGSLGDAEQELAAAGIKAERKTDAEPGIAELLEIEDLDGNRLQLYAEIEERGELGPSGVRPQKLGHACYFVRDVQATTEFYEQLGFRWSDWMGDFFVFLRCNADHHALNLLRSENNKRLHHIGWELRDWANIQTACDWLARNDYPLVWGPGRHGPGHNLFTYHRDPDGNVVELFAELDLMLDESLGYFDPRPWHHDFPQRPKVWTPGPRVPNSWGPMPPEGFLE